MNDRIETIIRDWLNKEFKNPDAIPGPMIKGLAEEIYNHAHEIYRYVDEEYKLEDIEAIEIEQNIKLTEKEKEIVLHRYYSIYDNSDELETLGWIIKDVIEAREEEE